MNYHNCPLCKKNVLTTTLYMYFCQYSNIKKHYKHNKCNTSKGMKNMKLLHG